ncbi:hypothetical protein [Corynebacterium appendicis]|uniref:hypothetical protein n=1 Tax=Corynebacterium appendicis TaxID=163202 RepID=UPI00097083D0|nr:hypothetical protein [Corynebacterium appendicis]MCT1685059.1 hypothetical protein [Corynebacterium appendicis]MDK8625048.1 hypothetical protein [Corynebacterium appendicis]
MIEIHSSTSMLLGELDDFHVLVAPEVFVALGHDDHALGLGASSAPSSAASTSRRIRAPAG